MRTILRQGLWIGALVTVVCAASWRLTLLAGQQAAQASPGSTTVRIVAPGQPVPGDPGKKGATYYSLEGQTTRLITAFVDGTKATAERGFDGDLSTTLEDVSGNEINRFKVDRVDGVNDVLQYSPFGSVPVLARPDPSLHPTLEWSNQQSHRLYQDRVQTGARLEWKGGMMRAAGAVQASDTDNDRTVRAVETHWANGLTARTVRTVATRGLTYKGKQVNGDILSTRLLRDGVEVGNAAYLTYERLFMWDMLGVSEGTIGQEELKSRYGGWRFTPNMVWMNLQTIGTYRWRTLMKEKGTVARRQAPRNRILEFFMPTVAANDEGCDQLHWLDGTIFRPCCDIHDQCYENNGCTYKTWWQWGSWRCDICNGFVIGCFATGAGHIRYPFFY